MKIFPYILSAIVVLGLVLVPSRAGADTSPDLTKQLAAVWNEIQKIKPGMTRAELTKMFEEDTGGFRASPSTTLSFRQHESFHYRSCGIIMLDVNFAPSDSKHERSTDIIVKISKAYLDEFISE